MLNSTSLIAAAVAATAISEPACPPDTRAAEEFYTYHSFDREAYDWAMTFLREKLPEWVEAKHKREPGEREIWYGETTTAYYNALNLVTGYTLKLEYMASTPGERSEREKAFCEYIARVSVID